MTVECHECDECGGMFELEDYEEADKEYLKELHGEDVDDT